MAYASVKSNSGKNLTFVPVAQGAAGSTVLMAAVTGKQHKIVSAFLVLDATGSIKFTDGSGDLCGAMPIAANGGFVLPPGLNQYTETGSASALSLVTVTGKAFGVVGVISE